MPLETHRLILRHFLPSDAPDLQEILGDSQTMTYLEAPYGPEKTARFLQEFCITKHGALAAVEKRSSKVIGYLLFHPLEQDIYEMGWIFHRNYWRQGYASEACQRLIQWGFSDRMAHKILAETIDPVKSVGLMKKLGMQQEGVQRSQTKTARANGQTCTFTDCSGRTGQSRRTTLVQTAQPFKDKRLTMCCHRTSGPLP